MSLVNATLVTGGTWSQSGGTGITLASDGRFSSADGVNLVVSEDTNVLTRRTVVARSKTPRAAANANAYATLGRNTVKVLIPFQAADGKVYNQTVTVEIATHAEFSGRAALRGLVASLATDSDMTGFWEQFLLS